MERSGAQHALLMDKCIGTHLAPLPSLMYLQQNVQMHHIPRGKPMQNGHLESFKGRVRDECLNAHWFQNLFDVRRKSAGWQADYNQNRPDSSMAYRTRSEFWSQWHRPSSSLPVVANLLRCEGRAITKESVRDIS